MKLLLFSDVHTDVVACERLVDLASQVDVVVGAGDFGVMRRGIDKAITVLSRIQKPAVIVPGNAESVEELQDACDAWASVTVLHGSGVSINGVAFYGVGGGIPVTPFGAWSYDFSEQDATRLLKDCPPNAVLVTHSPPKNTVDVASSGGHFGSNAIREAVERTSPQLVVCGHIHDSWEQRGSINTTPIINAGPKGIIYEL